MRIKKMVIAGFLLGIGSMLVACGNSKEGEVAQATEEYKPYGKYEEPVEFTIGRMQRTMDLMPEGDTMENSVISRYVEEQSNIKTKIAWESAEFDQKLALAISTGDIPDVMVVYEDTFKQMTENDLIADLSEVYEKAASDEIKARLDSYDMDVLGLSTVDGKLMGIPSPFSDYEHTVTWIRRDWVEKVGAEMPKTKEDLYELARLFVEKDISGTGNTIGISVTPNVAGIFASEFDLSPVFNSNNSFPKSWINTASGVEYGSIQPETKEVLGELRDLYAEGIIDKQFAVRTNDDRKEIIASQLGIHFGPFWAPQYAMQESVKNDSNADWVALAIPENEAGEFITSAARPITRYLVVRKGYEHPEAVMRALNLNIDFSDGLTEEARTYRNENLGEGKTFPWFFQTIDCKIDYTDANKKNYLAVKEAVEKNDDSDLPNHLKVDYAEYEKYQKDSTDLVAWGMAITYTDGLRAATSDNTKKVTMGYYGTTETMKTKWANLDKLESETFLKIIMGEVPLSEFDDFVETWKKTGGDEITKEVNEEAKNINYEKE